MTSVTQFMTSAADTRPNAIATIMGARRRTWSEHRSRVAKLAGSLRKLGAGAGDRVAILALNSDRYTEYYHAVWWSGAAVVPMNIRWTAVENAYSLNDSGAEILFVDKTFAPVVEKIREECKALKIVIYLDDGEVPEGMLAFEELVEDGEPCEDAMRGGEDLAGLYYTGGTTGFPKGVMLPHRALWYNNLVMSKMLEARPESIYLHAAPMFHLADGAASGGQTAVGATHVYIPMFDIEGVMQAIETHEVTHALLVPTMIGMLLNSEAFDPKRLSSLGYMLYGASPMPEGLLTDLIKRMPDLKIMQGYGQTELAPIVSTLQPEFHVLGSNNSKLRSAGRPVPGTEVKIVDKDGNRVTLGEVGEICARGMGAMQGYWKLDEQTTATLKDGWVHTGDGAYMDEDGFIFIADRMKDMIVTGGENVFSAEVESAISTHEAVAEVAVIGIPDDKWGEAVHAIIVPKEGAVPTLDEIVEHCRPLIANYKLPRSIALRDEPLPLSGAGKVLKRDLRIPYWEGRERQVN
ncbi:MAG: long-chain-fatty-acid--CoA ligase [Parvularculales bacterium]